MQRKASYVCNLSVLIVVQFSMPSVTAGQWIITHFSCTVGLQLFLLFLSYQDPIQLDIAEVETAFLTWRWQVIWRLAKLWQDETFFRTGFSLFGFLLFTTTWTLEHRCWLCSGLVEKITLLFLGKKISLCTFDIQMLFLNKVYVLVFFSWLCFISWWTWKLQMDTWRNVLTLKSSQLGSWF